VGTCILAIGHRGLEPVTWVGYGGESRFEGEYAFAHILGKFIILSLYLFIGYCGDV
jgi:hypothetical protein